MKRYKIYWNGICYGEYIAESGIDAINALCREAGYRDYDDAADSIPDFTWPQVVVAEAN